MEANEPKKEQNTEEMDVMKQFMELMGQNHQFGGGTETERAVTGLYGGLAVYRRDAVTAFRYGGRTAGSTKAA